MWVREEQDLRGERERSVDGCQGGRAEGRRSGSKGNVPPTNKCIRERVLRRVLRFLSSPRDKLRKGVDPKQTAGSSGLGVVGSAWREGGGCARSGFEEDWELGRDGAGEAWEGGNGDTGKPALAPARPPERGRERTLRPEGRPPAKASPTAETRTLQSRWGRWGIGNKSSTEGASPSNVSVPETRRRPGQGGKPSVIQSRVAGRLGSGEVAPPEEAGMNDQRWSSLQGREDEWGPRPWR